MECPKCGMEIDDKALVCPNCKKVLKLVCPVCKTINTSNTCKNCGYVIISKCHNCGKINQTAVKLCKKCGFDTEKSVIMNESNTDNFAVILIDFPNLSDMNQLLGSAKLFNKFKTGLDKVIADHVKSVGLRRQIIGKTYIIRCDKDYTFNNSAMTAVQVCVDLINKITAMNCKLTKKKDATIKSNFIILKKTVNDDPNDVNSGFNINLLNDKAKTRNEKILGTFQILVDDNVANSINEDYSLSPLNSLMINGRMVMISEVNVKNSIRIEFPEDESENIEVPNFVQNMLIEQDKLDGAALNKLNSMKKDDDAIYDIDTITFEEIKCDFRRIENVDVVDEIAEKLKTNPKGILSVKTPEMYKPYTLKVLNAAAESGQFNNLIAITCYDEMKYAPYSFFRDLVSTIFEYTVNQKLFFQNDFSMFRNIDPDGLMRDLLTLQKRNNNNGTENLRFAYYDIFLTMFQIIPKTLIYIEDFEKIDSSSYDVMKYLFQMFDQLDISFLISHDKNFSIHKDCHFLLMSPYYTEITLKAANFEKMVEDNKDYYKNILNDFYFQRIAKYACGSSLFIDYALQYLIEEEVYAADEHSISMINPKTIIIPSNLDKLTARRLSLLQDDPDTMKFLTSIVLMGTRIDMETVKGLEYDNYSEILEKLSDLGYLYEYNNCIYFPNYNLLRRNLLTTISPVYLKEVAEFLFEKVYNNADMPSTTEAYLYRLLHDNEKEQAEWEHLAEVDISLGDFNAYIHCSERILELLDENKNIEKADEINDYKMQIYEKISESLYDYIPEKTANIAKTTLQNIEKTTDTDKIIRLCNRMINGALLAGDYSQALDLMHKVLTLLPPSSINPMDESFNSYFFLMSLIHVQILFNIGSLIDCIDVGYKVLNVVNNDVLSSLKPEHLSEEEFKGLIVDAAGYVAMANVLLMTGGVQEFLNILRGAVNFVPASYDLFVIVQDLLHGNSVSNVSNQISKNDRFGGVLIHIISAFNSLNGNYQVFAEHIYRAKIAARNARLYQLELFADLLIGYAYFKTGSFEKAEHIIYRIIKATSDNGMMVILYTAWYIMSEIQLKQHKYDIAFGIINNTQIQLEKNNNISEYLLMLFKYNMYKVLMYKQEPETAEICINHAKYIATKYDINFQFDTDPNHYIPISIDEHDLSVHPYTTGIPEQE
ncbi:hypothetical protein J6P92_03050 [bacterium]|nr:hypothetical protein [bacterium]